MAISTDDLKTLVGLLTPVIKAELESGSTGVGSLEVVSSLEGVFSLPALRKRGEETVAVEAPVSLLKGDKGDIGDKGDDLEYRLLDSFPSLDALKAAYPAGTPEPGFFIAGDGMYVWNPKEGAFKEIRLEVDKVFTSEIFSEVLPTGDRVSIDFSKTPYARVVLGQEHLVYGMDIRNTREGSCGKVMVYQTGLRQLTMGERLRGTIDLPLNADTIAILSYNRVGEHVYVHTATVIGDTSFPGPQKVNDFQVVYSDSSSCTVQWTAPWANNIYDKGTAYDMRYANGLVEPDDPKVWAGLRKVAGVPVPGVPGTTQKAMISGLSPDKEYYVYLKTARVNHGIGYLSEASGFAYFRTSGSEDMGKAYRIDLTERNFLTQGNDASVGAMVDERERNVFLGSGYPDLTHRNFQTSWMTGQYSRTNSPYHIFIDLLDQHALDKLFVTGPKPRFSVYVMRDIGYPWERAGQVEITYNEWKSLDLPPRTGRYLRLSFDLMDFGGQCKPPMPEGSEGFPAIEYNMTISPIHNLLIYGRKATTRPGGIMPPARRATRRRTVDQWLCTNGHAYQQGRIHSMCSGEKARLYIHFGHLCQGSPPARLADMAFRVSEIPWIMGNNGTGDNLEDTLRDTYKRYGLKPYLCNTGIMDYCKYPGSKFNRPVDDYWLPLAWRPLPSRGVGGLDRYYGITRDGSRYGAYAKACFTLAARYGDKTVPPDLLYYSDDPSKASGLDLISGIEPDNEPDKGWEDWIGYTSPEEYAALLSATYDGHSGAIRDGEGRDGPYGVRPTGSGVLTVAPGMASVNRGYLNPAHLAWRAARADARNPCDAISLHMYFSNIGNQDSGNAAIQYGIPFEEAMLNRVGGELPEMCRYRDRFLPDKEIWLTEFGWGESGARDTQSKYQCYSMPGRHVGAWLIPDRHRSDVKGAWIVRACVRMMAMGVDLGNYYSTECESNYFDTGKYGQGAGLGMFRWEDCHDTAPGARVAAAERWESQFPRGGFSTTGLFGNILLNGAYPITRAYWWVAMLRNRLRGYVFTGLRGIADDTRIVVACFKRLNEDRGAYVVYLDDNSNTGVPGARIPLPPGVTSCERVTACTPPLPDPSAIPPALGVDRDRTGLAAARHERYEGGRWVPKGKGSVASGPATYPGNPAEGDEVVVLPTPAENPYFPVVGPVAARTNTHGVTLTAQQYERPVEGATPEYPYDISLAWRQVEAVCDFIDHHPAGRLGAAGYGVAVEPYRDTLVMDVSEFPEIVLFDAVPEPDYDSEVSDADAIPVNSRTIEIWWNNNNPEDTGYQVFRSSLPETGYTLLGEYPAGIENKAVVSGLEPGTTHYFKIRPVKGSKTGTLGGYVSAKTFGLLPAPTGLRVDRRTATSVTVTWDYPDAQLADWVAFDIYRADATDTFSPVGTVADQAVRTFTDTGLPSGNPYKYKARATGLNGRSEFSPTLETMTLLPEECPPTPLSAITDKLGTKVVVTLDLPAGDIPTGAKGLFTLTEDGNARVITSVSKDGADPKRIVIGIPEGSLSDHTARLGTRVAYASDGSLLSAYGVPLGSFSLKVVNMVGNFTDVEATFLVNLTADANTPPGEGWNDCGWNAETVKGTIPLVDTYGREGRITLSSVLDKAGGLQFGGNTRKSGVCAIQGIPPEAYQTGWDVKPSLAGRLVLSGCDGARRYTVNAYASRAGSGDAIYDCVMAIGTRVSNRVNNMTTDSASYMTLEDIIPVSGGIVMDFTSGHSSVLNFLVIEEYKSSDEPENRDVYLRSVTVGGDDGDGVVHSREVTLHLNCVGKATHYRTGETGDLSSTPWDTVVDDILDVPRTLSQGFGAKTLYAQVRNPYNESNTRAVAIEYRDPYVPLSLNSIYVNNNEASTASRDVRVFASLSGVPTHYRAGESAGLAGVAWQGWAGTPEVPYTLSPGNGLKTVYMALRDAAGESAVKADVIELTGDTPVDPVTGKVIVSFASGLWNDIAYEDHLGQVVNVVMANTAAAYTSKELKSVSGGDMGRYVKSRADLPATGVVFPATQNWAAPEGLDDSGAYPARYISRYVSLNDGSMTAATPALLRFSGLPAGTYGIRILPSCNKNAAVTPAEYDRVFYSANGVTVNQSFDMVGNKTAFVEMDGVVVGDGGILDLKMWNTMGKSYRPGVNLVEIILKG